MNKNGQFNNRGKYVPKYKEPEFTVDQYSRLYVGWRQEKNAASLSPYAGTHWRGVQRIQMNHGKHIRH